MEKTEQPSEYPVIEMYVCEIAHLFLHENQLYRFLVDPLCKECKAYQEGYLERRK